MYNLPLRSKENKKDDNTGRWHKRKVESQEYLINLLLILHIFYKVIRKGPSHQMHQTFNIINMNSFQSNEQE